MRFTYLISKIIIAVSCLIAMYLSAHFWIGSKNEWISAIENRFWEFFFSRVLFTIIVGGIFLLISNLINWVFRKKIKYKRKMVMTEVVLILLFAIVMTTIAVMK